MVASKRHGVIYTGATGDLARRAHEHREGAIPGFAKRYNCTLLVFAEQHGDITEAIHREKCIKEWPRLWKLRLIHEQNPGWRDLAAGLHLA